MRRVVVLAEAAEDIEAARDFYDAQQPGIGDFCADSLVNDIASLALYHGIHLRQLGPSNGNPLPTSVISVSSCSSLRGLRCREPEELLRGGEGIGVMRTRRGGKVRERSGDGGRGLQIEAVVGPTQYQ